MGVKIASAIVAFLISLACAVFVLFMMLLALNGYSESDAAWGLGAFIIFSLIICLGVSLASYQLASALLKRGIRLIFVLLTAIPASSLLAVVLETIASLIGVAISEFARVNY